MTKLHVAGDFSLPLDFTTQTQAVLAKRGVGKSYTASVEAEELLKARQQVVVVDPTGAWWGLKSSADGKSEGFNIAVFGGEHADVPLEETAGEVIAQAIVERRFSAILDFSFFRKGQIIRFTTAFAETLYRLNRDAMHLFVDEADAVAPQGRSWGSHGKDESESRMLGAMEDVVRRGRKRGIGCTLITQRPAVLNKNVLTQCEILCAMRLVHPKDIDAIKEWVNVHAEPDQAKEMISSLPSLPVGTAWFWAPGWNDLFRKVKIRSRETFDSSATPRAGEKMRTASVLAPVDIAALGEQIQSTVQRAKENDPANLKRTIAELRRELERKPTVTVAPQPVETIIEVKVPVLDADTAASLTMVCREFADQVAILSGKVDAAIALTNRPHPVAPVVRHTSTVSSHENRSTRGVDVHTNGSGESLPIGEKAILRACAQYDDGCAKDQLTVLTGYKRSSRDAYIQRLRVKGYVNEGGGKIFATRDGVNALGSTYEPLPVGRDLQAYWLERLPEGERRMLEILVAHGPNPVDREVLTDSTGYKRSSRDAYLQRLSSRRLVESVGRGEVKAADVLFD